MYTKILIFSEVSVFRTFTSVPINGLNIKFYASHFRFRISPCVMIGYDLVCDIARLTLQYRNFYQRMDIFGTFVFSIKVR